LKQASFFEAAIAKAKIGLSLKPNYHKQIKPSVHSLSKSVKRSVANTKDQSLITQ